MTSSLGFSFVTFRSCAEGVGAGGDRAIAEVSSIGGWAEAPPAIPLRVSESEGRMDVPGAFDSSNLTLLRTASPSVAVEVRWVDGVRAGAPVPADTSPGAAGATRAENALSEPLLPVSEGSV